MILHDNLDHFTHINVSSIKFEKLSEKSIKNYFQSKYYIHRHFLYKDLSEKEMHIHKQISTIDIFNIRMNIYYSYK